MTVEKLNPHKIILTSEQKKNAENLATKLTRVEQEMGEDFIVTSGVRTDAMQQQINPRNKKSRHLTAEAVDVSDVDGSIYDFCINNVYLLIELGLYLEQKTYTPRWVHFQSVPPKSGNRFFVP